MVKRNEGGVNYMDETNLLCRSNWIASVYFSEIAAIFEACRHIYVAIPGRYVIASEIVSGLWYKNCVRFLEVEHFFSIFLEFFINKGYD